MFRRRIKAFTLIELLIVVAIIGILAAIAIPNFLMAQTRAKVARVKSEIRTIGQGLELYYLDCNAYPYGSYWRRVDRDLIPLSTPVAYLSSVDFEDPFVAQSADQTLQVHGTFKNSYVYCNYNGQWGHDSSKEAISGTVWQGRDIWAVGSPGPDHRQQWAQFYPITRSSPNYGGRLMYDPSNGTVSNGDIYRYGGDLPGGVPTGIGG